MARNFKMAHPIALVFSWIIAVKWPICVSLSEIDELMFNFDIGLEAQKRKDDLKAAIVHHDHSFHSPITVFPFVTNFNISHGCIFVFVEPFGYDTSNDVAHIPIPCSIANPSDILSRKFKYFYKSMSSIEWRQVKIGKKFSDYELVLRLLSCPYVHNFTFSSAISAKSLFHICN